MTVLRFGTDTGHVTLSVESKPASAGGGFSQRVTPDSTLEKRTLACAAPGRQPAACRRLLEGFRGLEEVANSTEVGTSLRSGSQVRSD